MARIEPGSRNGESHDGRGLPKEQRERIGGQTVMWRLVNIPFGPQKTMGHGGTVSGKYPDFWSVPSMVIPCKKHLLINPCRYIYTEAQVPIRTDHAFSCLTFGSISMTAYQAEPPCKTVYHVPNAKHLASMAVFRGSCCIPGHARTGNMSDSRV